MQAGRLLPCSAIPSRNSVSTATSYLNKNCNPIRSIWTPLLTNSKKTRIFAVYPNGVPQNSQYDTWEDPDDGSNSDDEEEEEDEQGSDYESQEEEEEQSWDSEPGHSSAVNEDIIREVEQLLTPAEKVIWEQNEAPVVSKLSTRKWGILQTLVISQQMTFMDNLLLQGVAIDEPDKYGLTALHLATISKRETVVSLLLRRGANPNARDKDGATPLHYAVQNNAMQTVKLLIKYKVDVNAEDNEGWTPLHVAIQSRNRNIAKVLLVNGADKTRRTKDGVSVLDLCLCFGKNFKSYDLTKLVKLVPAGIDP